LRTTWDPFIHTHHYEIHGAFADSWLAKHPRRSVEAFWNQYILAQFINDHPIPPAGGTVEELVVWFAPLLKVERGAAD